MKIKYLNVSLLLLIFAISLSGYSMFFIESPHKNPNFRNINSLNINAPAKEPVWTEDYPGYIRNVRISTDEKWIIAEGANYIYYIETLSVNPYKWRYPHGGITTEFEISSNGEYFVALLGASTIAFFNKSVYGTPIWTFNLPSTFTDTVITPSGNYIGVSGNNHNFYLLNNTITSPKIPEWNYILADDLLLAEISPDGNFIATSTSSTIHIFNLVSFTDPVWNHTISGTINSMALSTAAGFISVGWGNTLSLFTISGDTEIWNFIAGSVEDVDISADGQSIAVLMGDTLYYFNSSSATPLWSYTTSAGIKEIALSLNGEYVVATDRETVYFFHRSSPKPWWKYSEEGEGCYCLDITGDGNYTVVGAGTTPGLLWLFEKGEPPIKKEEVISFGLYYIPFIFIGIVALIALIKIKNN